MDQPPPPGPGPSLEKGDPDATRPALPVLAAPAGPGGDPRAVPGELWARLRQDPSRAPEHLALAAGQYLAPQAERWIREQHAVGHTDPRALAGLAKSKHATLARFEGAATGVGGFVTVVPDLAALAWIQSRLVFFTAASFGWDPHDPMRPAELLVLQELYDDPYEARRALDGVAERRLVEHVARTKLGSHNGLLARRLAAFAGKRVGKRVAGRLIPGFAIAFNAVSNELDTRRLADRAIRFYGG